ncbi:MAG: hypothetical protein JSR45_07140 [Proteobacteria bacterium]|nr:hypothetical protein [Pseudomonadota bacterium]
MKPRILALAAVIATACSGAALAADPAPAEVTNIASGKIAAPPAGKAQVIFFRQSRFAGGGVAFTIKEGDVGLVKIGSGSYGIHFADPGKHVFKVQSEATDSLTMELDAGETYYVEETMTQGLMLYRPKLAASDEAAFKAVSGKLRVSQFKSEDKADAPPAK